MHLVKLFKFRRLHSNSSASSFVTTCLCFLRHQTLQALCPEQRLLHFQPTEQTWRCYRDVNWKQRYSCQLLSGNASCGRLQETHQYMR